MQTLVRAIPHFKVLGLCEGWGLSYDNYFPSHVNDDTQNKNVRQLVWHLQYVDTAVEGIELYCYNVEGDRQLYVKLLHTYRSSK